MHVLKMTFIPFLFLSFVGWATNPGKVHKPEPATLLSEYVKIESVSGNEKMAGIYLASLAEDAGLYIHIFTSETDSYNFAASLYPLESRKPNIILLNHIDVVPAGADSLWTYPPYSGTIADGYVWGRGAIDNKAMGIMHLLVLKEFVTVAAVSDLPYNVTMLSVSAEEVGGAKGAVLITDLFLDDLNPVVVYGEGGTGLKGVIQAKPENPFFGIEIAQKTGLWFTIRSNNPESGHGSVPRSNYPTKDISQIASALTSASQPIILTPATRLMFRKIGSHERGLRRLALRNIGLFRHLIGNTLRNDPITNALLTNTITLTNFGSSAGANNQVAQEAWATFDCRLLPETTVNSFLRKNKRHFGDLYENIEVLGKIADSGTSPKGHYYHAMVKAVNETFHNAIAGPILFPAHNDNIFFRAKGIPAYGLLPAILSIEQVGSIHNVDERMDIKSLGKGIEFYQNLLNILLAP